MKAKKDSLRPPVDDFSEETVEFANGFLIEDCMIELTFNYRHNQIKKPQNKLCYEYFYIKYHKTQFIQTQPIPRMLILLSYHIFMSSFIIVIFDSFQNSFTSSQVQFLMDDVGLSEHLIADSAFNQVSQLHDNALFNLYKETESQEGYIVYKNISIEVRRELNQKGWDSELIEHLQMERFMEGNTIKIDMLLSQLSSDHNIATYNKEISILMRQGQIWVRLGITPFLETSRIEFQQFLIDDRLVIRLKKVQQSLIQFQMCSDISIYMRDGPPKLLEGNTTLQKRPSCVKNFQTISYIVKKIISIKTGQESINSFRNDRKLSRKSVQDYFYQIKMGHYYGFDFNANSDRSMKFLREFVKIRQLANKLSRSKDNSTKN